jgi:hypothetical protein
MTRGPVGGVIDEGINWNVVSVAMVFVLMDEGIRMFWSQNED